MVGDERPVDVVERVEVEVDGVTRRDRHEIEVADTGVEASDTTEP